MPDLMITVDWDCVTQEDAILEIVQAENWAEYLTLAGMSR
jgi:hypothetical protein